MGDDGYSYETGRFSLWLVEYFEFVKLPSTWILFPPTRWELGLAKPNRSYLERRNVVGILPTPKTFGACDGASYQIGH